MQYAILLIDQETMKGAKNNENEKHKNSSRDKRGHAEASSNGQTSVWRRRLRKDRGGRESHIQMHFGGPAGCAARAYDAPGEPALSQSEGTIR